ncbi:protein FAM47A-like [Thamnophis elegans]|uniref:protein FAM47A-like n=1 Tax=Thamnophis elegans TaxID=35005 RepID=UPI00137716E3|nr:protein FAM47A-like [Thamnophis elegans]
MCPAPWYKEKLPSRCFPKQASNKEKFSDSLNGQRWRFLKHGLDDFRYGCPPSSDNIIIQGTKGPAPIILQYKKLDASQIIPYKSGDLLRKRSAVQSRLPTPQKTKTDPNLTQEQHPLALYPHLEESVPPDLFDDVMKLLDPEMQLTRPSPDYSKDDVATPSPGQHHVKYDVRPNRSYSSTLPWMQKKKNPYTWFSKKEVAERQEAAKIDYVPPLDKNVKRVTKEFCEWVNAMGGEKYNIDEDTIMKLFDTRYESDIKTSTPIKIMELYQIPAELRQYLGRHPSRKRIPTKPTPSEPKWEKIKYGAWYLPPKTWKKKRATEKEEIPECLQIFLNARKKIVQKAEADLESSLHGTYAFDQFLETKGYRKPQFLLQMLAAGHSDKIAEDSELLSRKLSMKVLQEFRSQSSANI